MAQVFISHASENKDIARQLSIALARIGIKTWFDETDIRPGAGLVSEITEGIATADYFIILLSQAALTKSWVRAEIQWALAHEIEHSRPRVIPLMIVSCEIPFMLSHKLCLDFRDEFDQAFNELSYYLNGISKEILLSKQEIIARMIIEADSELWGRLKRECSEGEWKPSEVANTIRELNHHQLEAAVAIGWEGPDLRQAARDLVRVVHNAAGVSESKARQLIQDLASKGFLEEAAHLDSRQPLEKEWDKSDLLVILKTAARRTGLFPKLPFPIPERLSAFLAYEGPLKIICKSNWYGVHYSKPIASALDPTQTIIAAVVDIQKPQTWVFRSRDDRGPLITNEKHYATHDLTPSNPSVELGSWEFVDFELSVFDDLKLLRK